MPAQPLNIAAVLHVSSIERAVAYYTDVLGFSESFRHEFGYVGLESGEAYIHLAKGQGDQGRPIGGGSVYFFLASPAEVDQYFTEVKELGATITAEPKDYPYGMHDFGLLDPDGNALTFGARVTEAVPSGR